MPQKKWVTITKYNASAIQLRIQNKHKTPSLWCDFHIKWAEDVILDDDDNSDANDDGDNGDNDDYDDDDDDDDYDDGDDLRIERTGGIILEPENKLCSVVND